MYTNYVDQFACSGVCHIGISDNSLIYVYRKLSLAAFSKGHLTISYRNFQNFNRESFRNDITQQDWSCNGSEDPNVLWTNWKTKFLDIVNNHAPLLTNKAPWINSQLKKGMHDPCDWHKYKKLRKKINNNIKTSKASYYFNAFIQSRGNPRKTWQTFNELTSRRVKELKLNDAIISNSSELSNAFNLIFQQLGPELRMKYPQLLSIILII